MNFEDYARARRAAGVREPSRPKRGEMELQARFYAGDFGLAWTGTEGERVEALHLGAWNREPGPDFVDAEISIDGKTQRGHIELDPEDADWERHGHASNPDFDDVLLHVFFHSGRLRFYTRTSKERSVVQVKLEAATLPLRRRTGDGSQGKISPESARDLISAAAHFRLTRKREAWLRAEALHGRPEALFQAVASGMGYKNNRVPFLLVAQRVGWERALKADGESLLFGVAGFLEARFFDHGSEPAREYLRGLWETWWRLRAGESRLMLPCDAWKFAALRPSNHPHRRMAALALAARSFSEWQASSPSEFLKFFRSMRHPFWDHHSSLLSDPMKRPCALVGGQRAADLAANALAPSLPLGEGLAFLRSLPSGSPIGKVKRAMHWLTGSDLPVRNAFEQQGLLQLHADFFPTAPDQISGV